MYFNTVKNEKNLSIIQCQVLIPKTALKNPPRPRSYPTFLHLFLSFPYLHLIFQGPWSAYSSLYTWFSFSSLILCSHFLLFIEVSIPLFVALPLGDNIFFRWVTSLLWETFHDFPKQDAWNFPLPKNLLSFFLAHCTVIIFMYLSPPTRLCSLKKEILLSPHHSVYRA